MQQSGALRKRASRAFYWRRPQLTLGVEAVEKPSVSQPRVSICTRFMKKCPRAISVVWGYASRSAPVRVRALQGLAVTSPVAYAACA